MGRVYGLSIFYSTFNYICFMKDTLLKIVKDVPQPQSIRMETPIGAIEVDESPMIDVLIIILMFSAFCIYVYAKYLKKNYE